MNRRRLWTLRFKPQILELMMGLQSELGTCILLITQDMGVIAETASRVAVMYDGRIVETADVRTVLKIHSIHTPRACCGASRESMPKAARGA